MKTKIKKLEAQQSSQKDISRMEAIKKAGRYAAVTSAAMFIVLYPKKAQADSPPNPGDGWQ